MNSYTNAENIGRTLFTTTFGEHLHHHKFAEEQYSTTDFYAVFIDEDECAVNCTGEIKAYRNTEHPRTYYGSGDRDYNDYMIDAAKLMEITKKARNTNTIPILVVFFGDRTVIWNLDKFNWRKDMRMEYANKDGMNYGTKEWDWFCHIKKEDAVYDKEI